MADATRGETPIRLVDWFIPLAFFLCASWVTWQLPAFILFFAPPENPSLVDQLSAQFIRNDALSGLPGMFGGLADPVDWIAFILIPILMVIGVRTVRQSHLEHGTWNLFDRFTTFIGRVTMVMIALMVSVMLYEVMLRYVFERPTLWANELSLWMAGFVFLFAGFYAMQQRSHITIFLAYDMMPRWLQRACDVFSTFLILLFAAGIIYGGFGEARDQFLRWETFGTAFDPPIPVDAQASWCWSR